MCVRACVSDDCFNRREIIGPPQPVHAADRSIRGGAAGAMDGAPCCGGGGDLGLIWGGFFMVLCFFKCSAIITVHLRRIGCWDAIEFNRRESTITKRRLYEIMRENNTSQPPALLWRIKRDRVRAACSRLRLQDRTSCVNDWDRSHLFDCSMKTSGPAFVL